MEEIRIILETKENKEFRETIINLIDFYFRKVIFKKLHCSKGVIYGKNWNKC